MTNFEYIKSLTQTELSHFLCEMVEEEFYKTHDDSEWQCDKCPVQDRCHQGGNGWLIWLREAKK
jgi:hypothetical protein